MHEIQNYAYWSKMTQNDRATHSHSLAIGYIKRQTYLTVSA